MVAGDFTPSERALLHRLKTPAGIQRFLDRDIAYNKEPDGPSCLSPRRVLRERRAHCMEGALFAAAALRVLGFPPLLLDLEAVHDDDHVLAIFQQYGHWGAIAKSNYSGLRYREPVYRAMGKWLKGVFPVSTGLVVQALARPEWVVEIDVTAVIPDGYAPKRRGKRAKTS